MPVPTPLTPNPWTPLPSTNALAVHRCRFVDYNPAAITAVAFPHLTLPSPHTSKQSSSHRSNKSRFGTLAVGRANGNIELYEWAVPPHEQERTPKAPQAWVLAKILYGPNPSKVDSLVFTLRYPHLVAFNEVPALANLRLFSAGGGSELVEWDIPSGTVLRTLNSQGGAIWSMAANPASTRLALGCEDGCVRILDVASGEFTHLRRFDRVKCRMLSIAWGPPVPPAAPQKNENDSSDDDDDDEWTDGWLVTGGSDSSLRKWDAKTGRVMDRMSTDKVRGERTLVWAVGVLADGTIISGDSLGVVKFWDSRTCTQLHTFSAHGADVLCMAIGPDGNSVFTSGVDQKVCLFTHVKFSNPDKTAKKSGARPSSRWVQSTAKRMHSHDVRALAVWPPYLPISASHRSATPSRPSPFTGVAPVLASGGLDASLVLAPCATAGSAGHHIVNPLATSGISTFEDAYHRRLAYPTGLSSAVSVARTGRLIICARDTGVTVWRIIGKARIASALEADLRAAQVMDVDSPAPESKLKEGVVEGEEECGYEKLLEMDLDTMTNICASAVSDDGRWLAVSDVYEVKLFELLPGAEEGSLRPRRVKSFMPALASFLLPSSEPEGASVMGFTPDGGRLVLAAARSARVLVVDLSGRSAEGRPEPRVLRAFEHHARCGALFARGRVVKGMPERASEASGVKEGGEKEKDSDVEMGDEEEVKEKEEGSEDEEDEEEEHALVTRMAFSPDGQWFATTDDHYRTHVFNLDAVQHHTLLPTSPAPVTAIAFSPSTPGTLSSTSKASSLSATLLVLAHADATIGVFDVETRRFAPWAAHLSQRERLPRRWASLHDGVLGIAIEPPSTFHSSSAPSKRPSSSKQGLAAESGRHAVFWGATWLCRVVLDAPSGWGGFVKKRRRDGPTTAAPSHTPPTSRSKSKAKAKGKTNPNSGPLVTVPIPADDADAEGGDNTNEHEREQDGETATNFKLVSRYRPILCADFLANGELLVVERPLVDVLRGLPPAFFKPRYGS